jgi:cytidine deaminase
MAEFKTLDQASVTLIERAASACENAYAPYSRFHVGTALLLDNGQIIAGANVENAAFPQCLCAEQVALAQKATVFPSASIVQVAVVARKADDTTLVPVTPCGGCRQVLLEFEARQKKPIKILMQTGPDVWTSVDSATALLPFGFVPETLL